MLYSRTLSLFKRTVTMNQNSAFKKKKTSKKLPSQIRPQSINRTVHCHPALTVLSLASKH